MNIDKDRPLLLRRDEPGMAGESAVVVEVLVKSAVVLPWRQAVDRRTRSDPGSSPPRPAELPTIVRLHPGVGRVAPTVHVQPPAAPWWQSVSGDPPWKEILGRRS